MNAATVPQLSLRLANGRTGARVAIIGLLAATLAALGFVHPVAVIAALGTGFFNTAGGGGAVITFVALTMTGVPALTTHATSQAVTPGSFLGMLRFVRDNWPGWRLLASGC